MAAVEGIFIALLAIVVIGAILYISGTQYDIIDVFTDISLIQHDSGQEDIDIDITVTENLTSAIFIKNKSPIPVSIIEVRVIDDNGDVLEVCDVSGVSGFELGSGQKTTIGNATLGNVTITNATITVGNLTLTGYSNSVQDCLDKAKLN